MEQPTFPSIENRGSKNSILPKDARFLETGNSGVAMSLGKGWNSSRACFNSSFSSAAEAIDCAPVSIAAKPAKKMRFIITNFLYLSAIARRRWDSELSRVIRPTLRQD